ncbi:hypothetical protein LIX60_21800 [Streptomyces sp. S07_1.15]|uniref:hypothetical protein n=1 Tax=Streptomyces sp. S07_1.15 TaxID=2873925 RepID=UPI001D14A081|nr:hypothetical protein [Streptomyces sp. S07_1.15]MCC3654048.1 hypothetical protein [Streptomyces sp. S07_1.15]
MLIKERRLQDYHRFRQAYEAAARELAETQGPASLRSCTIGRRQFVRWAHGDMRGVPRSDARRVLERMFLLTAEQLFSRAGTGPADTGAELLSADAAHCETTGRSDLVPEDVVMAAAHESARFAAEAERSNIGPHTMEQLDADIRRIVGTYPNRPVGPLFMEVRELRNRAFELLEGQQPPQYTKDLYLAAGILCGVLANASFDMGRYAAAETQARAGFLCAELAGHNGLRAWIRGLQALVAYWDGRPRDAVRLAASGRDFRPESGTAHIRLASIEARAYGQLNSPGDALAALRTAETLREQAVGEDIPGGMMAFPRAKQLFYASSTHLWLGGSQQVNEAEARAEEAVELYESDPLERRRLGELSLARMDLALARLGRGDLDGTAGTVHTVLGMAARRPTESVTKRLEQFGRQLAVHPVASSPTAANLQEAIASHTGRERAALPPGSVR